MHDALAVGELQSLAHLVRDAQRLRQRDPVSLGCFNQSLDVAATHQLGHDVGLAFGLAALKPLERMLEMSKSVPMSGAAVNAA